MKKRVAIIGTAGIPARYGGFETLADNLVKELNEDLDFTVYCSGKETPRSKRITSYNNAKLVYLPLKANGTQSIIYDCVSIIHALFVADTLLILGVPGAFILPFVRLFTRKTIITSVDGIEWKRNKWSKVARFYLWVAEWFAVNCSHANIADNESIQDYTAMRYGSLSKIIEYGGDHTTQVKPSLQHYSKYPFLKSQYAIKVCRIEPENNIHVVLEAFAQLPAMQLAIVGNWNNSAYGQQLKSKYAIHRNIYLLEPIYDQQEIDMLRSNAALYIHGHSAGGTNPSLVEAMSLGLPVLAWKVSYNKVTTENKALYFSDANELEAILKSNPAHRLQQMGNAMNEIAGRRYTWRVIARKYLHLINAVADRRYSNNLAPQYHDAITADTMLTNGMAHLATPAMFYEKR